MSSTGNKRKNNVSVDLGIINNLSCFINLSGYFNITNLDLDNITGDNTGTCITIKLFGANQKYFEHEKKIYIPRQLFCRRTG
jgi:hypothetical protein